MNTTEFAFVNINGAPVDTNRGRVQIERPKKLPRGDFHDGFVVQGIPPGVIEPAEEAHRRARTLALENGAKRVPAEWDAAAWMAKAKRKRVRTKPYELRSAAQTCADMATHAGWLAVEVRELKKGESA